MTFINFCHSVLLIYSISLKNKIEHPCTADSTWHDNHQLPLPLSESPQVPKILRNALFSLECTRSYPVALHLLKQLFPQLQCTYCGFLDTKSHLTFSTPCTIAHQASLSFTISGNLLRLMSTESLMPSNHLILCRPLLLLPSIFPSNRIFSNVLVLCIMWSNDWSFSFSISPSNEYSGSISFRIDWCDLLTVQETLKNLLQHHSQKASVLQHSVFFTFNSLIYSSSLTSQLVKNPPAMQETPVRFLSREEPLKKW